MHTHQQFTKTPPLRTVADVQNASFEQFQDQGLPHRKLESWKYTPSQWLTKAAFDLNHQAPSKKLSGFWDHQPNVIHVQGDQITQQIHDKGVHVWSLKEGIVDPTFENMFSSVTPRDKHALYQANSAMVRNGVCIAIAEKATLEHPIYVVYQVPTDRALCYVRTMVFAAEYANAKVIEVFASEQSGYYTNAVFQAHIQNRAKLTHIRYQNEASDAYHTGFVLAQQRRNSHFDTFSLVMGAKLARQDIETQMIEEGAHCGVYGVSQSTHEQVSDLHTLIHHRVPSCSSDEHVRSVLFDQAHTIFEGKVVVDPQAQKTDAKQMNRNLLLSEQAHVDTAPQLEIFADDVKCAHGATVGKLDPDQLFYLRSRGIAPQQAQRMLIQAFMGEILDTLAVPALVDHLYEQISNT
jgi:Fe-S cluster assembly protein SufD